MIKALIIESNEELRRSIETQLSRYIRRCIPRRRPKTEIHIETTSDISDAKARLLKPGERFEIVICAETVGGKSKGKHRGNGLQLLREVKPALRQRLGASPLTIVMIDGIHPISRTRLSCIPREMEGRARSRTLRYLEIEIAKYYISSFYKVADSKRSRE